MTEKAKIKQLEDKIGDLETRIAILEDKQRGEEQRTESAAGDSALL
jgi:chaperonin cofactor prefoldin